MYLPTADMYLAAAELHKRKHSVKEKTNKQTNEKFQNIQLLFCIRKLREENLP